ncbi:tyrosine-protein phosphatase [Tomitella gaofuii]|uniref:tyrosine-protein phosphatase n=1 Tax=Tomitella gaofuii TaxID=2760083 RepID=UPI002E28B52C|nr:tyrosine-protein phosphatase [Tomitella gaofuii]
MTEQPTGIRNWRDLGGIATVDGRIVRPGAFFRSAELSAVSEDDRDALSHLGIGPVFDLRTDAERTGAPDDLPDSATVVPLDVLADKYAAAVPTKMQDFLTSPQAVEAALGGGRAAEMMAENYRAMVTIPSAVRSYRAMVRDIAADPRPALVHCTSGKDRTGWGTAIVLFAVGADEQSVQTDYLRTNELYLPTLTDTFARFEEAGGNPDDLRALLGVRPEYLQAALDEARTAHGSLEAYLSEALGIDDALREALRARLLLPD